MCASSERGKYYPNTVSFAQDQRVLFCLNLDFVEDFRTGGQKCATL